MVHLGRPTTIYIPRNGLRLVAKQWKSQINLKKFSFFLGQPGTKALNIPSLFGLVTSLSHGTLLMGSTLSFLDIFHPEYLDIHLYILILEAILLLIFLLFSGMWELKNFFKDGLNFQLFPTLLWELTPDPALTRTGRFGMIMKLHCFLPNLLIYMLNWKIIKICLFRKLHRLDTL